MKSIIKGLFGLMFGTGILFSLQSCDESLNFNSPVRGMAEIESISPTEGAAGTLITVKGKYLQWVSSAYLGGEKVNVKYRVSGEELVVEATASGRTGHLELVTDTVKSAPSSQIFTYQYLIPSITIVPEKVVVGEVSVLKGVNLNAVSDVYINGQKGEIISTLNNEIAFKTPFVPSTSGKITIEYFDGTELKSIESDIVFPIEADFPTVTSISNTSTTVGGEIILTGTNLQYIDSIKAGNTNMMIISKEATSLTIKMLDNTSEFVDGNNVVSLTSYSYQGEYVVEITNNLQYYVNPYYTWSNITMHGRVKDYSNEGVFFNLDNGVPFSCGRFDREVDPFTNSKKNGGTGNVLNKTLISKEEYESVTPYIYLADQSSNISFWSPANSNGNIKNFYKDVTINSETGVGTGGVSLTGNANYCGTPVVGFRILDANDANELAVINMVKNQTFTEMNFTSLFLNSGINLSGTDANGFSNAVTGSAAVMKNGTAALTMRTFSGLPLFTGAVGAQTHDASLDAVIVVFYYKYDFDVFTNITMANVHKTGFIRARHYHQLPVTSGGAKIKTTFDCYWQRTPNP